MPFGWTVNPYRGCSHACTYCLEGGTKILLADGRTKALSELKVGDEIYGTRGHGASRRLVPTRVEAHWTTLRAAYRVTLEDGTRLVAGGDHRFLTSKGWKHVTGTKFGAAQRPHLEPGTELIGVGRFAPTPDETLGYRAGYLCGMLRSGGFAAEPDAATRALEYLPDFGASVGFLQVPADPDAHWQRGFLAGLFDIAGDYGRGVLTVAHDEPEIVEAFAGALTRFGFAHQVDEVPKFPARQEVRLLGGTAEVLRFLHVSNPGVAWKRSLDGAVIGASRRRVEAIEPLGLQLPLFDITTGTGDFIADGMVSHNCFARNTHTYLDFDAGHDFDTQVVVKVNAPEVLAAQLKRPSWRREHVAMGTNTDPYQRAEGRYRLMPGIITALARSGTPLSVLTKGTVLARDLPLLQAVSADVPGQPGGVDRAARPRAAAPPRTRHAEPAGAAGAGPQGPRRRTAVFGAGGAGAAVADGLGRGPRRAVREAGRSGSDERDGDPAAPAPGRPGVVRALAGGRVPGAGAAVPRAVRAGQLRAEGVPRAAGGASGATTAATRAGTEDGV